MTDSRRKGHAFEREIVNQLRSELGSVVDEPIKRILDQYRESRLPDIIVPPFAIECKRYARGCGFKTEWWDQVVAAAEHANLIPALVYRFDRQQVQCVLPLYAINDDLPRTNECRATVDWFEFVMLMRENLASS
jgi:Holliday junction resolvase